MKNKTKAIIDLAKPNLDFDGDVPISMFTPTEPPSKTIPGRKTLKAINKWFKNRFLKITHPKDENKPTIVEELIKEMVFTNLPLEKIPSYGREERLVCFHLNGVPVLGQQEGVEQLGLEYHELKKVPVFQRYLPLILTIHTKGYPSYKFYALEKEDISAIGNSLVEFKDVLWVGVHHREHWLQIWGYGVGTAGVSRTIDYWYPTATAKEIEASRF